MYTGYKLWTWLMIERWTLILAHTNVWLLLSLVYKEVPADVTGNHELVRFWSWLIPSLYHQRSVWLNKENSTYLLIDILYNRWATENKKVLVLNFQLIWHRHMHNAIHRSYTTVKMVASTRGLYNQWVTSQRYIHHSGYERRFWSR